MNGHEETEDENHCSYGAKSISSKFLIGSQNRGILSWSLLAKCLTVLQISHTTPSTSLSQAQSSSSMAPSLHQTSTSRCPLSQGLPPTRPSPTVPHSTASLILSTPH